MDQTLAKFEGRNISLAPSSPSSPFLSSTSSGSTSSSIGQTKKKDNSSLSTSSSSVFVRGRKSKSKGPPDEKDDKDDDDGKFFVLTTTWPSVCVKKSELNSFVQYLSPFMTELAFVSSKVQEWYFEDLVKEKFPFEQKVEQEMELNVDSLFDMFLRVAQKNTTGKAYHKRGKNQERQLSLNQARERMDRLLSSKENLQNLQNYLEAHERLKMSMKKEFLKGFIRWREELRSSMVTSFKNSVRRVKANLKKLLFVIISKAFDLEEATGSLKRSVQYTSRVFARQILSLEPLVFPAYRADPQKFQNPQARDNVLKYAEKLQDRIPRVKIKERKEKKKSGEKGKGEEKGKKKTKKKTEKKKKEFYSFESDKMQSRHSMKIIHFLGFLHQCFLNEDMKVEFSLVPITRVSPRRFISLKQQGSFSSSTSPNHSMISQLQLITFSCTLELSNPE